MALTTNIQNLATRIATEMKSLRILINGNASDLSALNTTNKTNLVAAINEVAAASGAAPATLQDLTDVTISAPSAGQALIWDGTEWVNDDVAPPIPDATESVKGIVELATNAETSTGTDSTRAVTPAGLKPLLDAKASSSSLAAIAFSGDASDLTGTIPSSALPPLAVTDVHVVNSLAEMTSLTAQAGDVAKRTDNNRTYILAEEPASESDNWIEVVAGGDVLSVAGRSGAVVLTKSDVGLSNVDNTSDAAKPISTATQNALNGKQNLDATLTALAGLTTEANQLIYSTGSDTFSTSSLSVYARTLLDDADAATARGTLGLGTAATAAATSFQSSDATLTALAGLTTAANQMVYSTGPDAFSMTALTAFARTLLDDANSTLR